MFGHYYSSWSSNYYTTCKKTFYAFSFLLAAERIEKMELLSLLPPTIIPRDYTYDDVCMTSDFSQPSTTKLKLIQHDSDNNFLCYIIFFEWEREWRCSFEFKMEVSSVVTQTQLLRSLYHIYSIHSGRKFLRWHLRIFNGSQNWDFIIQINIIFDFPID